MRSTALGLAALLATAAPVLAAVSSADRSFLAHEAQGNAYELAIAQLAAQKASRDDIKTYAQRVVSDHETANTALQQLAQGKGVTLLQGMTGDEQTRFAGLQNLRGADFDRAYLKETTRINAEDKRDFAKEGRQTHDPEIRAYVQRFSAMDAQHERAAKALTKP
jgi:putative membrane protein